MAAWKRSPCCNAPRQVDNFSCVMSIIYNYKVNRLFLNCVIRFVQFVTVTHLRCADKRLLCTIIGNLATELNRRKAVYAILNERFTLLVEWTVVICSACIDLINSSVPSDMFFLIRLPSKQQLRWLRTMKPLPYRDNCLFYSQTY